MSNDDYFESSLVPPVSKFVVTDHITNKKYTPGTTGYIATAEPRSGTGGIDDLFTNIQCVIIRVGKKGKKRIESNSLLLPTFFFFEDNFKNQIDFGRKVKEYNGALVHAERIEEDSNSVLDLDSLDFLGWVLAYAQHLTHTHNKYNSPGVRKIWPKSKRHILNMSQSHTIEAMFADNSKKILDLYKNIDLRMEIVDQIRSFEVLTRTYMLNEFYNMACGIFRSIGIIDSMNNNKKFAVKKKISNTKDFYKNVRDNLKMWNTALSSQTSMKNKNKK